MEKGLSLLSITAAIGIDNNILGKATEESYEDIEELTRYLREAVHQRSEEAYLHGNQTETLIMWEAFGKKQKYTEEVALQTSLFVKQLENIKTLPNEELAQLRGLCVKISRASINYEDEYSRRFVA